MKKQNMARWLMVLLKMVCNHREIREYNRLLVMTSVFLMIRVVTLFLILRVEEMMKATWLLKTQTSIRLMYAL